LVLLDCRDYYLWQITKIKERGLNLSQRFIYNSPTSTFLKEISPKPT
jgi:hypothetical protein